VDANTEELIEELKRRRDTISTAVDKPDDQAVAVLREKLSSQEKLLDALKAISSELDPHVAQGKIIEEACRLLDAERASFFRVDIAANELVLHTAKGADDIRVPMGKGIAGAVAQAGESLIINDPYSDARFDSSYDKKTNFRTTSILCVPVRGQRSTIGVIQVINKFTHNGGLFTEENRIIAERLATLAGISLSNAQVYEDMRLQEAKTKSLINVVGTMSANLGLSSVTLELSRQGPLLVNCATATVYLCDYGKDEIWSIASDHGSEIRLPMKGDLLSLSLGAYVGRTGIEVDVPDCYADTAEHRPTWGGQKYDEQTGKRTNNMLVLPIKSSCGEVVGVIQLINKLGRDKAFAQDDKDTMNSFLAIAGNVIKGSQFYTKYSKASHMTKKTEAASVFGNRNVSLSGPGVESSPRRGASAFSGIAPLEEEEEEESEEESEEEED